MYAAAPKLTVTEGTSSSVMVTVASSVVPAVTAIGVVGSVPNSSFTDSPSSSTLSVSAVKTKVFSVSPLLKVTLLGTPE